MFDTAVLIAATGLQPALRSSLAAEAREILSFSDSEALKALEVITTRRPGLVAMESGFAGSPRGVALRNRIAADPALASLTIRVVATDAGGQAEPLQSARVAVAASVAPVVLDFRGTRRAPRFVIDPPMDVLVDGKKGSLVDLSVRGAQLLIGAALRPHQRVRLSLADQEGTIRCGATVIWALYEMPKGAGPRYRVGLNFIEPNGAALEGYIGRHKRQQG